jgi:hypothetical protein
MLDLQPKNSVTAYAPLDVRDEYRDHASRPKGRAPIVSSSEETRETPRHDREEQIFDGNRENKWIFMAGTSQHTLSLVQYPWNHYIPQILSGVNKKVLRNMN